MVEIGTSWGNRIRLSLKDHLKISVTFQRKGGLNIEISSKGLYKNISTVEGGDTRVTRF